MKVLVANVGSTSFKYKLFEMDDESVLASGGAERVKSERGLFSYRADGKPEVRLELPLPDHNAAITLALDKLVDPRVGALKSLDEVAVVGFKTVLAGDLPGTALLTDEVVAGMENYNCVLPAHNPPYIAAIRVFQQLTPGKPLVGVFEPGFHRDRPKYTMVYGVPYSWYEELGIKKYGYHGNSHRYVSQRVCEILGYGPKGLRIITCHLGGSSSLCAIKDGRSVDTSMGFSAQSGILNSTRNGDLDPFVLIYVMREKNLSAQEVSDILTKEGGLAGISGLSGDIRDLEKAADQGNERAQLALDVMVYDVKRYIGAYAAILGGVDVLTFAGGIGEKGTWMRSLVCQGLEFLGIRLDEERNRLARGTEEIISQDSSSVKVVVVPTNEELMVARETTHLVKELGKGTREA
ncbi:acetate/propionate family kinase [Chloroflexota bacterium]